MRRFKPVPPASSWVPALLLLRKLRSTRFVRVESIPPYWVHTLEIRDEADIDDEVRAWLPEAATTGAGTR